MSPGRRGRLLLHIVTAVAVAVGLLVAISAPEQRRVAVTLPIRDLTPGAVDASVTAATVDATACSTSSLDRRPRVSAATRRQVFASYGISGRRRREYRVVWLIPPSLGGSNVVANLFPRRIGDPRGARIARTTADLHDRLCKHEIGVAEAQRAAVDVSVSTGRATPTTAPTSAARGPTSGASAPSSPTASSTTVPPTATTARPRATSTTTNMPATTIASPTTTTTIASPTTTTAKPAPTTTPPATMPPGSTPPSASPAHPKFYRASSSWNTKVPSGATYTKVSELNEGGGWITANQYSAPVVVARSSDPVVTIAAPPSWGWPAQTIQLHVPVGQSGATGTDGSLVVVDGNTAYDFWQFARTATNSATVSAWAQSDLVNGTGWGQKSPFLGAGIHATGSALLAGLVSGNELTAGIDHALAIALGRNLAGSSAVGDAIASDGPGGPIPEGARLAIPRATPMPGGLTAQGKVLWTAMQEYGGFVIDQAPGDSHAAIFWADPMSVPTTDVDALLGPNWTSADASAIVAHLERVD